MKNFTLCFWAVLLSLLVSCGNEMSIDNSDAQDKQAGTGTYITINSSSLARTIRPSSEEVKALEASLTDFTFTGTDSYSNEITFTQTPISSIEQLKSQRFAIAPGTWSFTLSAKLGASSTTFTSTLENIKIEANRTTPLSFVLASANGGGMSITVAFTDNNITKVEASLSKLEGSFTERTATFNQSDFTEKNDLDGTSIYSVTYSCDGSKPEEELSGGTYHIVFDFYAEGTEVPINSIPYDVRVVGGITTSSEQKVSLNETYTITYNCDDGTPAGGAVLPQKYSRKSYEIPLPQMEKPGYVFAGWFADSAYTKKIESIEQGSTGNKELHAAFINSITVKAGGSANANFIANEPVDSIDRALDIIRGYMASDVDWTIKIDGTVYGTYILNLESSSAKSLTFAGKNENTGDDYTDILDGGSIYAETKDEATIKGSIFTVYSYCVPVTIKNLKLTHGNSDRGYGGAFDSTGDITLENGAWLTDNHTYYSGGAVMNNGTFTMKEGSRITDNSSKDWGGAVWNSSNGTFIMEGGEISGNTSGQGAAICHSGTELRIGGSANIPAGSDPTKPQDVYLMSESPFTAYSITVGDSLSALPSVIKINADSQYKDQPILVPAEGVTLTSDIISKFEIVQPDDGTGTWNISNTGTLEHTDEITTGTTLYNYDGSSYKFYDEKAPGTQLLELSSNNFAYDKDGDLFAFSRVDTSASIVTSKPGCTDTEYAVDCVEMNGGHGLMIDRKNNVLYTYFLEYDDSHNKGSIYKYESFISTPSNSPTSSTYEFDLSSVPNLKVELMQVYDGELYIYGNKILAKATIEASAITGLTKVADISLSDGFPGAPYDYWTVSDMLYQDGCIYLLYNEKKINPSDSEMPFLVNRGAVIRVRVNDGTVGTVDSCGWANEDSDLVFLDFGAESTAKYSLITQHWDESYNSYAKPVYTDETRTAFKTLDKASFNSDLLDNYNSMTIYDSSNNPTGEIGIKTQMVAPSVADPTPSVADPKFYSPQKFIAIKPKKLVIADSGIAFYTDDGMWAYKNVNRIVTVDLERFVIESVKDAGVRFNAIQNETLALSGSGYYTNYLGEVTGCYYNGTSYEQGTKNSRACWLGIPNTTDTE